MKKIFKIISISTFIFLLTLQSCKKSVDVTTPVNEITAQNVYSTDATAAAVVTAFYQRLVNDDFLANTNIPSLKMGLSADELQGTPDNLGSQLSLFYENLLTNAQYLTYWEGFYNSMFAIVSAIEGITGSSTLTPVVKQRLLGECRFMRAFINFYLVNLYGDVPLIQTSDYRTNQSLSRTPKAIVWQQIISDLNMAQGLLSPHFLGADMMDTTTSERVRPNKWAATALLSRSYLYNQKWDSAEVEASMVINESNLFGLDSLNGVFLANSTETIWQLQPVTFSINTWDGYVFILTGAPSSSSPAYLSNNLLGAFEPGDNRMKNWVDSVSDGTTTYYFPYKYKIKFGDDLS